MTAAMTGARASDHPRIAVVGSINLDLVVRSSRLPRGGETVIGHDVQQIAGGKGANQAVAAARLGATVSMIGRVGGDEYGPRLRAILEREGVLMEAVNVTSGCSSGLAVVAVEDSGENAITVIPGANARLTPGDVEEAEAAIRGADVLLAQLEVPMETVVEAIRLARQNRVVTILDPAPAPSTFPEELLAVDLVCPNESEAAALTGMEIGDDSGDDNRDDSDAEAAARRLCELGARRAVITLGRRGALLCDENRRCQRIPGHAVTAVDTTAAGDAFAAALGVAIADGLSMEDAVRFACAAGAVAATRAGAQPAMPTRDELAPLLARRCDAAAGGE